MRNHLAKEDSPYLLQHSDNPVNWFPWSPEALDQSKQEDKPIFLSIGYSACHWCHVMEHESFENDAIADILNNNFISIKVDREERPDLDQIYMHAVQLITGRGGWPMSVFLTPELEPFYGGTYWPPNTKMGMPGFDRVLNAVIETWKNRRAEATDQARLLTERIQLTGAIGDSSVQPGPELLLTAADELLGQLDDVHGGFGNAPKFPQPMPLQMLMRVWKKTRSPRLEMAIRLSLEKMANGGIHDHLAGGFARYSVDNKWLVPHFEKMLYDNALLADAYLDGFETLKVQHFASVARNTLDYVVDYMTDPGGGFQSTEDADSEGEEGRFYVWTRDEIETILGSDPAARFCLVYGVTDEGNFEGKNFLHLPRPIDKCAEVTSWDSTALREDLAASRAKLLRARNERVRPSKDDKILTSWNGLMINAFARAAAILDDSRYLDAAKNAADFIHHNLRRGDGRLLHSWRKGRARLDAYLDDYAALANSLISLYEASSNELFMDRAITLAEIMLSEFLDDENGGFFFTGRHHEQLITRPKEFIDNATPSSNALAATALIRLGTLSGKQHYMHAAEKTLRLGNGIMERTATGSAQLLIALDMHGNPNR